MADFIYYQYCGAKNPSSNQYCENWGHKLNKINLKELNPEEGTINVLESKIRVNMPTEGKSTKTRKEVILSYLWDIFKTVISVLLAAIVIAIISYYTNALTDPFRN